MAEKDYTMDLIGEIIKKDLRDYLETFEGHKFKGNMTLCPFHDDHVESMSVDLKDGAWLWFCHKCSTGGNIIHYVMKKYGLEKREALKKLALHFGLKNKAEKKPKIVEEYPYLNEERKELYRVVRFDPKDFRCKHKVDEVWKWDKKGIRQVLYNLPEVLKHETIWLLEGEKDVENVKKLGLTATSSPFGVSNWKSEFVQPLKGKIVRICLDKGTEKEAERRAKDIVKVAKEVKIIELPELKDEGQDITDWIEMNDSVDYEDLRKRLKLIAQEVPVFVHPKQILRKQQKLEINNEFLSIYVDSISKITDAPKIFILFSGIGLLSAVLNKYFFYYPLRTHLNLYILLLAPSTFYRKSLCIDIASNYLSSVNPALMFPESFSTEALLDILSQKSRGLLTWRELIQVKEFHFGRDYNKGLPSLLTNIYDYKDEIRHLTKKGGETVIKGPVLSILAAGISDWLVEGLNKIDFQGGIWTRFSFVPTPEDEEREFRLPTKFIPNPAVEEKLKKLNELKPSEMNLQKIYPNLEEWGTKHLKESLELVSEIQKASFQRLEVTLIKIACILQLAQNNSTVVEPETFKEAVELIECLKRLSLSFFKEEIQFSIFDKAKAKIKKVLRKNSILTKSKILQKTGIESELAEKVLRQLIDEEKVKPEDIKPGEKGGRPGKTYCYIGEE